MPPCGSTGGRAIVDALSPIAGFGRSRPIIPSTTFPTVVIITSITAAPATDSVTVRR
jgi:hypothetical protein